MKTGGAPGGRIKQALIPGLFLIARWLRNRKAGVMMAPPATLRLGRCRRAQWSVGLLRLQRIAQLMPASPRRSLAIRFGHVDYRFLGNKVALETAQKIAAHESPRTTKLYDGTDDQLTLDEIEKISV